MLQDSIPEGFHPFPKDGSYQDTIAPVYVRMNDDGLDFALKIDEHHCNALGICHGAVLMGLMDLALVANVAHAYGEFKGMPTININLNYLRAGKKGEWIQTAIRPADLSATMGFCEGTIVGDKGDLVHASGRFKLPPPK